MLGVEIVNVWFLVYCYKIRYNFGVVFLVNKDLYGIDKLVKFFVFLICWLLWEVNFE